MSNSLHSALKKTAQAFLVCMIGTGSVIAQISDNALAFNTTGENTPESAGGDKAIVAAVTNYTNIQDINVQSYFSLVGDHISPYMQIKDANQSFDPQVIEANTVSFSFRPNTIEAVVDGNEYTFSIVNLEQYQNTSDKCMIRTKMDVEFKAEKINGEKVSTLSIYVDRDNHISFIQLGNTEYYLRP